MPGFPLLLATAPLVDIILLVFIGNRIGFLETFGLLVLSGVAGISLIFRVGLAIFRDVVNRLQRGEAPTERMADGMLVLAAGALLLWPGFLTDLAAASLAVPRVRRAAREYLLTRFTPNTVFVAGGRAAPPEHSGASGLGDPSGSPFGDAAPPSAAKPDVEMGPGTYSVKE